MNLTTFNILSYYWSLLDHANESHIYIVNYAISMKVDS